VHKKAAEAASASIGCCGVDPARYARRCRAWASLRAAGRSQLRREGLIAPQAITAFVVGLGAIPQAS